MLRFVGKVLMLIKLICNIQYCEWHDWKITKTYYNKTTDKFHSKIVQKLEKLRKEPSVLFKKTMKILMKIYLKKFEDGWGWYIQNYP